MVTLSSMFPLLCTPAPCASGSSCPGGSFAIFDFAAPLRSSRNLHVCSVVVHIWWLSLVSKPLFFYFRASVCTSRSYILGCHEFVILIVLLSSPGIIRFFSILRVLLCRLAVSRFRRFSDDSWWWYGIRSINPVFSFPLIFIHFHVFSYQSINFTHVPLSFSHFQCTYRSDKWINRPIKSIIRSALVKILVDKLCSISYHIILGMKMWKYSRANEEYNIH